MEAFENDEVLADMKITLPASKLQLKYGDIEVTPGQVLTPTQVKDAPSCKWDADPNSHYSLIMNDPDAPSRAEPKFREWHHWFVGNIPGNDVSAGEVLSEYIGPGPPKNTKLHRYALLVYKQNGKVDFSGLPKLTNKSAEGRQSHQVIQTVSQFHLKGPVAGNFFQAEFDDYVPELHKRLGGI